jgi:hypothetical protein
MTHPNLNKMLGGSGPKAPIYIPIEALSPDRVLLSTTNDRHRPRACVSHTEMKDPGLIRASASLMPYQHSLASSHLGSSNKSKTRPCYLVTYAALS